jgi:hypothetical protein
MWKRIFIILGIIFSIFILLAVGLFAYLAIVKPFGISPTQVPAALIGNEEKTESSYDHPFLSTEQEIFLENVGVDTAQIPVGITAGQEACAVEKLGQDRVDAIKAGADLKTSDYLKAGNCFQ